MKRFYDLLYLLISLILFISCGDNSVNPDEVLKPEISSINPTSIFFGDEITITGKNFGSVQDTSKVYFNEIIASNIKSWSDNSIKLTVPNISSSGKIKLIVKNLESNSVDFTLDPAPRIVTVSISKGKIGQDIELIGLNFGIEKGVVEFNGVNAPDISLWTNTRIIVKIPKDATTGNIVIKVNSLASKGYFFIVEELTPAIEIIEPNSARIGEEVSILGKDFDEIQGLSYVEFNGIKAKEYTYWSSTFIKLKVPENATSGEVKVFVNAKSSNGFQFSVKPELPTPVITSLSKNTFDWGETIQINGANFGETKTSRSKVVFNGMEATDYSSWQDNTIIVKVPNQTISGKVVVMVEDKISNGVDYEISITELPPIINSITPILAPSGEKIQIYGDHFGEASGANAYVMFGNKKATTTHWSNKWITAEVPEMPSGPTKIYLSVNGNNSNEVNFTVQSKAIVIVEMVEIPSGIFMMGHPNPLKEDAYPEHKVTFTKPLLVAKTEITQAQYKKVMNQLNPSVVKDDNNPVEQIKWYSAIDFCNRLSKLEGLTECYIVDGNNVTWNMSANGYRLLTEAEWEYACRAGSDGDVGYFGSDEGKINEVGWTTDNCNKMNNVGLLKPNDFGLYDMHGNAAEWVWDYYDYYEEGEFVNPTGPKEGVERVFRGGSYKDSPSSCYNYVRNSVNGLQVQYYIGFRICREK